MDFKAIHQDILNTINSLDISLKNNPKQKIYLNDQEIFLDSFNLIAGPCSIESYEQLDIIAKTIKEQGGKYLRAGTYKLRTSPSSFQGLGLKALKILKEISTKYNLISVSELPSLKQLPEFLEYVDIIVVGMRNMRNFEMLKELGKINKPILLKRGDSATILELIFAAKYIYDNGNKNIILCERGIKTFENLTRNTLDLVGAKFLQDNIIFPTIIDPSHSIGFKELIPDFTIISKKLDLSGAIVEIAIEPDKALSDGFQSITLSQYKKLVKELNEK